MTKPLKVAHITTIDASLRYLLLNQLRYLQQQGYEVVGVSAAGPDVFALTAAGIRHLAVPMTRQFTPAADLRSLWQLVKLFRQEKFTIVHTHTPKPGLIGQCAARLAGVPIVLNTLHGFYFHDHTPRFWRNFYIFTEKIAARCSDVILSQNSEDIQTAIREKICPPHLIQRLGNGIDVRRFDPSQITPAVLAHKRAELGLDPTRPVLGFVGRLVAEKGILDLLKAMQEVIKTRPDAQLLLVGPLDHEKKDALTPEVAHQYGLEKQAIFAGHREDMPEMYALMDLFVLPSYREGFPRSPMEATSMGVPCVVTDIRGCREAVYPGRNGLLVPLGNPAALAQAILTLLDNDQLTRQLRAACRKMALELFDEQKVFALVHQTYQQLLNHKFHP
jgi:glycosyltransferase involved in cell wall biosynthesis